MLWKWKFSLQIWQTILDFFLHPWPHSRHLFFARQKLMLWKYYHSHWVLTHSALDLVHKCPRILHLIWKNNEFRFILSVRNIIFYLQKAWLSSPLPYMEYKNGVFPNLPKLLRNRFTLFTPFIHDDSLVHIAIACNT